MTRYSRNVKFSEIGEDGQKIIGKSHVAVVGCGALGGTIATHLVRAGIGKLTICDNDDVDIHNIQRQILYDEKDIEKPKIKTAVEKLHNMNSDVEIEGIDILLDEKNAQEVLHGADMVLDGTDNMETRYVINGFCAKEGIPFVYGGAIASYGMTLNYIPKKTACLECVFPQNPKMKKLPTCADIGIINTIPAIIASIQATEAIKILLKKDYSKYLIIYDVWQQSFDKVPIKKRKNCSVCG
ncbi:MAG: HesA/MoeB/ThiF family protein [Candidatus Methanofastidiosia archaeon]